MLMNSLTVLIGSAAIVSCTRAHNQQVTNARVTSRSTSTVEPQGSVRYQDAVQVLRRILSNANNEHAPQVTHRSTAMHQQRVSASHCDRSYNNKIRRQRNPSKAVAAFDEMVRLGCLPDVLTLNVLLNAFSNDKQDEFDAWKYYNEITREHGVEPDIITANTLLKVFERKSNLLAAERVWKEVIDARGLIANPRTYHTMIRICSNDRNVEKTVAYFDKLETMNDQFVDGGFELTVERFNQLFKAFSVDDVAKFGFWNYYHSMIGHYHLAPDIITATTMLKVFGLGRKVDVDGLVRVWDEVIVPHDLRPNLNERVLQTVQNILDRKDVDAADLRIFEVRVQGRAATNQELLASSREQDEATDDDIPSLLSNASDGDEEEEDDAMPRLLSHESQHS